MCSDTVAPTNGDENDHDHASAESARNTAEDTKRETSTTTADPVDAELAQNPSKTDRCGG